MSVGDRTHMKSKFTTNSMDGYSYPFNFSEVINSEQEEGELVVKMICNGANMCNLTNTHIAISPVLEIDKWFHLNANNLFYNLDAKDLWVCSQSFRKS